MTTSAERMRRYRARHGVIAAATPVAVRARLGRLAKFWGCSQAEVLDRVLAKAEAEVLQMFNDRGKAEYWQQVSQ